MSGKEDEMSTTNQLDLLIADFEVKPVPVVDPGTSLAQAARVLAQTGQGVLVVGTTPLGEISEADIVEALASGRSPVSHVVELTRGVPQFVRPDTKAEDAAAIMIVTGRRDLVVVDDGHLLGVVELRATIGALWAGPSWLGALRVALHVGGD
jgi:CBS domain-containing protein